MILFDYRKPVSRLTVNDSSKLDTIVIHHTGNDNDIWENTNYHIDVKKWAWLGYAFYIAKGKTYWVRGYEFQNAGVLGHNDHTINITIQGNYEDKPPSKEDMEQLKIVIKRLIQELPHLEYIKRHGDFVDTGCPGNMFPVLSIDDYKESVKYATIEQVNQLRKSLADIEDVLRKHKLR